jgi:hypothetical protein
MAFLAGQARPADAGRRAGTPNKINQHIRDRLAKLHCDPLTAPVKMANDPETPLEWK